MSLLLLEEIGGAAPTPLALPVDRREAVHWQPRQGRQVLGVVEHIGVAPTFDSLVSYLVGNNDRQVSATFVVGGDFVGQWALLVGSGSGTTLDAERLVRAANHAGIQTFPNSNPRPELGNPNWWTVGKEHVGYPGQVWSEAMIQNDLQCNAFIRAVLGDTAFTFVLGHHNFDPRDRASCPGPTFPWDRVYGRPRPRDMPGPKIPIEKLRDLPVGDFEAYARLARLYGLA